MLDQLDPTQAGHAILVNQIVLALAPSGLFGYHVTATAALTLGVYGGPMEVDGVLTLIADQTVALTASTTNYVESTRAGVLSANTTAFTPGRIEVCIAITGTATITGVPTERRGWIINPKHITHEASVAVTSANVTLTAAQARADYLITTGVLTGNRQVILPLHGAWDVFVSNTGAYTVTFIGATGTGIVVAQGKRARLRGDGTNIVRMTADV